MIDLISNLVKKINFLVKIFHFWWALLVMIDRYYGIKEENATHFNFQIVKTPPISRIVKHQ